MHRNWKDRSTESIRISTERLHELIIVKRVAGSCYSCCLDGSVDHKPASALSQPRYYCINCFARIKAGSKVSQHTESAPLLLVFICEVIHTRVPAAVCLVQTLICGELLEEIQPLPVTIRGVTERGIVCVAESCREDSPRSGGQEGDAVMMNPPTLTKWEFTFFATCGENCYESKIPC